MTRSLGLAENKERRSQTVILSLVFIKNKTFCHTITLGTQFEIAMMNLKIKL